MSMAHPSEEATKPERPFRRGSLVVRIPDMEYNMAVPTAPAQRVESQSSVPPKYPSRKASMDLNVSVSHHTCTDSEILMRQSQTAGEIKSMRRRSSLVWTVTSTRGDGEDETEHIYLKVSGFNVQERLDASKNERPRVPHRLRSMDMASGCCA